MTHEEVMKALERMLTYKISSKSKFGMTNVGDYILVKSHIVVTNATILDCITLLTQSGSNTKAQVVEKLKGLIE